MKDYSRNLGMKRTRMVNKVPVDDGTKRLEVHTKRMNYDDLNECVCGAVHTGRRRREASDQTRPVGVAAPRCQVPIIGSCERLG